LKPIVLFFLFLHLFFSAGICASTPDESFIYDRYEKVLVTYVDARGMVDYKKLKANREELRSFLHALDILESGNYEAWSEDEKIAFWINVYNALTIEVILDNYPINASFLKSLRYPKNSIRQIPGVWDKITFRIMGRTLTLDFIEHQILRKEFKEPRIHVALVCAAKGCPALRREPYKGEILHEQLDEQARGFLSDRRKFFIVKANRLVFLSPIFKWFVKDFASSYKAKTGFKGHDPREKTVLSFISLHLGDEDRKFLEEESYRIKYLKYDWTLNEKESQ
jgi:hypothetical protein